jgi:succinate--hydroxymethylglutarate CoA-transferase
MSSSESSLASVVPYRAFKTADGDFLVGGGNDRLFGILCAGLGKSEWASDERFADNASRVANRDTLEKWIEELTMQKTTEEWLQKFEGTGLPYAKVNDLMDTVTHSHGELKLARYPLTEQLRTFKCSRAI